MIVEAAPRATNRGLTLRQDLLAAGTVNGLVTAWKRGDLGQSLRGKKETAIRQLDFIPVGQDSQAAGKKATVDPHRMLGIRHQDPIFSLVELTLHENDSGVQRFPFRAPHCPCGRLTGKIYSFAGFTRKRQNGPTVTGLMIHGIGGIGKIGNVFLNP